MESTDLTFPVSIDWCGGKRVRARVDGKDAIEIATPPEFGSGIEGVWSPEDFLVAAAASCFAVTLVSIADRSRVPLLGLAVDGVGVVGRKTGFEKIALLVAIETGEPHVAAARKAADRAERHCLVGNALAVPVEVDVTVLAADPDLPPARARRAAARF